MESKNYCKDCEQNFATKRNLNRHYKTQVHLAKVESKPAEKTMYSCTVCDYETTDSSNYKKHVKIHARNAQSNLYIGMASIDKDGVLKKKRVLNDELRTLKGRAKISPEIYDDKIEETETKLKEIQPQVVGLANTCKKMKHIVEDETLAEFRKMSAKVRREMWSIETVRTTLKIEARLIEANNINFKKLSDEPFDEYYDDEGEEEYEYFCRKFVFPYTKVKPIPGLKQIENPAAKKKVVKEEEEEDEEEKEEEENGDISNLINETTSYIITGITNLKNRDSNKAAEFEKELSELQAKYKGNLLLGKLNNLDAKIYDYK